eukprot:m.22583 g.22583  ORF g.22583 m.22583 type:complete len:761 (+) comp13861_c0_seq1:146-2428(+)
MTESRRSNNNKANSSALEYTLSTQKPSSIGLVKMRLPSLKDVLAIVGALGLVSFSVQQIMLNGDGALKVSEPSIDVITDRLRKSNDVNKLDWTIFITPQGFVGAADQQQRRAILSWQKLSPPPKIVLMGHGERYYEVAKDLGLIVNPHLDVNLVKMPLAGSLFYAATRADTDVSVIINSDVMLTQSFVDGVVRASQQFDDWFLTGARIDITDELPPQLEPTHPHYSDQALSDHAKKRGTLHSAGGADYFAWNNKRNTTRRTSLIHGNMPPFIRGKSKFDNWIVHEVVQAGYRDTIDGTEAIVAVHVNHGYTGAAGSVSARGIKSGTTFWMSNKANDWQLYHNNNLARTHGSYQNQDGTTLHPLYKLVTCITPSNTEDQCLVKRVRPGVCPCEHHAFSAKTQTDPQIIEVVQGSSSSKLIKCGAISSDNNRYDIPVRTLPEQEPVYGLPFTLRDLLPIVAKDNHVLVTGISYNYRDMLMNFVCNLRRLGIYDHLVIAAWDVEMYKFGFKLGLPIFLYESDIDTTGETNYGSQAFRQVTKLKSKVVLSVLKLGYDVTWTDTDIIWFQDPFPLLAQMPSDFVVQSNAPSAEAEANGPLRINSGFYRVRSSPLTIAVYAMIVKHASETKLSEQPSFYMVLCGGKEGKYKVGSHQCNFSMTPDYEGYVAGDKTLLLVQFLDRTKYPNGAVNSTKNSSELMWGVNDLASNPENLVILHNNWVQLKSAKVQRMVEQGLWYYDRDMEICRYTQPVSVDDEMWQDGFEL